MSNPILEGHVKGPNALHLAMQSYMKCILVTWECYHDIFGMLLHNLSTSDFYLNYSITWALGIFTWITHITSHLTLLLVTRELETLFGYLRMFLGIQELEHLSMPESWHLKITRRFTLLINLVLCGYLRLGELWLEKSTTWKNSKTILGLLGFET